MMRRGGETGAMPISPQWEHEDVPKTSRRHFLKGTAALAVSGAARAPARQEQARRGDRPILAYVGTYSSPQGPEGSVGHGKGIYLFEMNPETGALSQREIFSDASNPSWLAL